MGKGGGSTETATEPWEPQGKQLTFMYDQARSLYEKGPPQYPDFGTVAGRHQYSSQATEGIFDLATGGGLDAAIQNNEATLRGDFLSPDSNPYLRQAGEYAAADMGRAYSNTVAPGIASRFGGAGRSAGPDQGAMGNAERAAMSQSQMDFGDSVGQMFAGLYGQQYQQERGIQAQAQSTAIGLQEREFQNQAALAAAGRDEFQYAQLQLNDAVQAFNFNQYAPYEQLSMFKDFISGGSYGTSTTTGTPGAMQYTGLGIAGAGALGSLLQAT